MSKSGLLYLIRQRLAEDTGRLRQIAADTGISYDTILRIKNGEGDPGYSKVQTLATYYGLADESRRARKAA